MGKTDTSHGGEDPGAVGNNLKEKDLNLQAALYMYKRLKELGVPVAITRDTDETLDRNERVRRILDAFGDDPNVIVVSNHINAGGGEGAEIVYALRNNDTLAKAVLEGIGSAGQKMRKVYQRRLPEDPSKDYYFIQRLTGKTEPILVEYGFIDNAADAQKLKTRLDDFVEGAVKAITEYAGYKYTPPTTETTGGYYTVEKGDSLWSIANKFNTTVEKLRELNNLTTDVLQIGQRLKVTEQASTLPEETTIYIVQRGDTLYSIANKFNTTVEKLKELNNLTSNTLSIGQELIITEQNLPTIPETPTITYTVQRGDTLYGIASKYNTTVDEIKRLNNLTSNTLTVGQQLQIPTTEPITPPEEVITYTVQKGDSLWSIANTYNTTVAELRRLNNLTGDLLSIGQQLLVPATNAPTEPSTYIVQKGDSLWLIANKYNTTVGELKRLNNLTSDLLSVGQVLILPTLDRTSSEEEPIYNVVKGDSLWLIAKKYNTTVTDLINYNQLKSIQLNIGDRLRIPNTNYNHYTVKRGDSLWSIAASHNLSIEELKRLNNLKDNSVTIGQTLIIS